MIVVIWAPYLSLKIIFPSFLVCHFSFIFFVVIEVIALCQDHKNINLCCLILSNESLT